MDPATAVAQAVDAAKSADVVVIVAGLSGDYESEGCKRFTFPVKMEDQVELTMPYSRPTTYETATGGGRHDQRSSKGQLQ